MHFVTYLTAVAGVSQFDHCSNSVNPYTVIIDERRLIFMSKFLFYRDTQKASFSAGCVIFVHSILSRFIVFDNVR